MDSADFPGLLTFMNIWVIIVFTIIQIMEMAGDFLL